MKLDCRAAMRSSLLTLGVRVTVEGGTPTQNMQPLTWDPRGYYELALDAGSVTWSP